MPQEQWLSRDREDDECSEESLSQKDVERDVSQSSSQEGVEWDVAQSSSQEDVERDVSHTSTLRRYQMNYPEQGEDFQKVFENMQVLRNTMNNSSTGSDQHSKNVATAAHNLLAICDDIDTSTGDVASKKMRVLDFLVEIEAAQLLQRLAQNYFKDFNDMGGEWDDNNISQRMKSKLIFLCLKLVLGVMHYITDLHNGFCSASAKAGVVPMCLENIVRLDRENDNWQNEDEESNPLQIIYNCIGILHNISRRLRDRKLFLDSEKTLLYFAKVKNTKVAPLALLCLAYLVNEDTNHLISADENLLCFIITLLNEACQCENRRWNGYSTKELTEGLNQLAINDNNKKILGQNGAIRVLTALAPLAVSSSSFEVCRMAVNTRIAPFWPRIFLLLSLMAR